MNDDPRPLTPPRRPVLEPALASVHAALDSAEIWHCLAFGTLLGGVREGRLIAWDHDIDLWVRPGDRDAILALAGEHGVSFVQRTFEGSYLAVNPGRIATFDPGVFTIRFNGATVGELWAPTLFADGVLRMYDLLTGAYFWPQSSMPHHHFETLGRVELGGGSYPVPAAADVVLARLYGDDWRTPTRAPADGGRPRPGHAYSGDRADPRLREWIADCEAQGWDRRRYGGQPPWPRPILGAGPHGSASRAGELSGSEWWSTLEELSSDY